MIDEQILSGERLLTCLLENREEIRLEAQELILMALKDLAEDEELSAPRCAAISLEWQYSQGNFAVESARFLKRNECCLMHEFEVVAAPGGMLRDGPAAMRELLEQIDEAIDELIADTKDAIAVADENTGAALP